MPGYPNWKIRNCPGGVLANTQLYLETVDAIEPYLQKKWADGLESFTPEDNAILLESISYVDKAENCMTVAKHVLAKLFPGHPNPTAPVQVESIEGHFASNKSDQIGHIVYALEKALKGQSLCELEQGVGDAAVEVLAARLVDYLSVTPRLENP